MLRMRRYRIFLLVAAFAAGTLYYLVDVQHATVSGLDNFTHFGFGSSHSKGPTSEDETQPPHHQDSAPVPTVAQPPLDPELELPPSPKTTSAPHMPIIEDFVGPTSTSSALEGAETVTGEDLLPEKADVDHELREIFDNHWEADNVPPGVPKPRWRPQKERNPIAEDDLITLPTGKAQPMPKIQHQFPSESNSQKADRQAKLTAVREAFKHAWQGYEKYAIPHDELLPLSNSRSDSFMGWGATLIDSLDTLWIMEMKEDFEKAVDEVKNIDFLTSKKKSIPMFETVIRLVGGLLSAYDLSDGKHPILLNKTVELADILIGAFDTPNRMPDMYYKWAPSYASQQHRSGTHVVLAELGSLSMEFTRLAQLTGEQKYYDAVARVQNALEEWQMKTDMPGLWPWKLDASGCKKSERTKLQSSHTDNAETPILLDTEQISEHDLLKGDTPANLDSKKTGDLDADHEKRRPSGAGTLVKRRRHPLDALRASDLQNKEEGRQEIAHEESAAFCQAQGLSREPYAKKQVFAIAARADSTYEYMPKMHRLLGGLSAQYMSMYKNAMTAVRKEILYRPMIEDAKRPLLFPAVIELEMDRKDGEKRKTVVYEATHLGCFAGGMFALGAKTLDIPSDMEVAKRLTDGCVWAYESTPTKIMPESFELTPCDDPESCPWNEAKWHKALDPKYQERLKAVEAWNKEQEKVLEHASATTAPSEGQVDEDVSPAQPQATIFKGGIKQEHGSLEKRAEVVSDEGSVKAPPHMSQDRDISAGSSAFVPKVALSHEKYAKARIQEERLPPGYTRIRDRSYGLRPEAIESVFIMWRLTGDESWRQKGWAMFQAVQEGTHTEAGNAPLQDVTSVLGEKTDKMESFWLGETLKYFYLLFSDPDLINLDDYVLNTEAHPFKVPKA